MTGPLPPLDPLLHQPARTQLVAYLSGRGEATFSELKRVLGVTDGNLGAHLGKLVEAGYLATAEAAAGPRAQTAYHLTDSGRAALADYVARLTALVGLSAGDATAPRPVTEPTPEPRS
ncbi:MAG: transcriptional regulator [Gallionellaceae bacterium]|nr:transcriptional regulator [Gallionellaceae bacterium]